MTTSFLREIWEDVNQIIIHMIGNVIVLFITILVLKGILIISNYLFVEKTPFINFLEVASQIGLFTLFFIFVVSDIYHEIKTLRDRGVIDVKSISFSQELIKKLKQKGSMRLLGKIIGNFVGIFLGLLGVAMLDFLSKYRCPECNRPVEKDAQYCKNCNYILRWT